MATIYWPMSPSKITEGYGYAEWRGGIHDGIDFGVAQGTDLRATASGTIRNVDAGQKDGCGVDITTPDGWVVRHWHVSAFLLPNGTQVEAGQVIAKSGGAPGTWGAGFSTGAHLHWGTKVGGKWVDPASLNPVNFGDNPTPGRTGNNTMYVVLSTDGRGWLVTPNSLTWVQDPGEFDILKRILSSNPSNPDTFVSNQLDAVSKYFH